MTAIRVLVADDDSAVVDVLEALIKSEPELRFVGSANDAEGAITLAVEEQPDVALVDVRMPAGGGIRAARGITRRCPTTKVIALTAHEDDDTVIAMMGAGAHGYVCKGESTERILREIYRRSGADRVPAKSGPGRGAAPRRPGARRSEQQRRIRDLIGGDSLRAALEPIVNVEGGAIVGVEAITRVARVPVQGLDAWLAEAEAAGMLVEFELAAIRAALADLPLVPSDAFLAIDASPSTVLGPELMELLLEAPTDRAFDRIVIQLTEQAPVHDYAALNEALHPLRDEGVRLAVTDVGGGIASLRHVAMLAPDLVKIDTALTDAVDTDAAKHAVVAALAGCAAHLGARTIAANVRTFAQLEELGRIGIGLAQGPLVAELGRLERTGS